jgi:MerR family transcriptional regulator, aldehyde-responsive regulator
MDYFTLQEVTFRTGLSEHTLRYYERIGLLEQVRRDQSSGHRRYTGEDVRLLELIACLRATGMSIEDMRKFRELAREGRAGAQEQVELFEAHRQQLELELARKQEHLRYLELKVEFWKAVVDGDDAKAREVAAITHPLSKRLAK